MTPDQLSAIKAACEGSYSYWAFDCDDAKRDMAALIAEVERLTAADRVLMIANDHIRERDQRIAELEAEVARLKDVDPNEED